MNTHEYQIAWVFGLIPSLISVCTKPDSDSSAAALELTQNVTECFTVHGANGISNDISHSRCSCTETTILNSQGSPSARARDRSAAACALSGASLRASCSAQTARNAPLLSGPSLPSKLSIPSLSSSSACARWGGHMYVKNRQQYTYTYTYTHVYHTVYR